MRTHVLPLAGLLALAVLLTLPLGTNLATALPQIGDTIFFELAISR